MDDTGRIARSIQTLVEMLEDRIRARMPVDDDTVDTIVNASVQRLLDVKLQDIENASTSPVFSFDIDIEGKMRMVFNMSSKFRTADVKRHISTTPNPEAIQYLFIVYRDKPTKSVTLATLGLATKVQLFDITMLQFNAYRHPLVPVHRIMNATEITSFSSKYSISSRASLPQILSSDPVCRYLDISTGEMVEIRRPSVSAIEMVTRRICI